MEGKEEGGRGRGRKKKGGERMEIHIQGACQCTLTHPSHDQACDHYKTFS